MNENLPELAENIILETSFLSKGDIFLKISLLITISKH